LGSSEHGAAIMNILPSEAKSNPIRTYALVAVATVSLMAACGTGIAAFAGLLPASNGVAEAVTAMPLIDMQFDMQGDASVEVTDNRAMNAGRRALRREAAEASAARV
jgi:hypothetical protein